MVLTMMSGFEGVAVGDNFRDFMDRADGGNEGHKLRCRPQRPTEAKAKAISA